MTAWRSNTLLAGVRKETAEQISQRDNGSREATRNPQSHHVSQSMPVAEEVQPDQNSCPAVLTVVWVVLELMSVPGKPQDCMNVRFVNEVIYAIVGLYSEYLFSIVDLL